MPRSCRLRTQRHRWGSFFSGNRQDERLMDHGLPAIDIPLRDGREDLGHIVAMHVCRASMPRFGSSTTPPSATFWRRVRFTVPHELMMSQRSLLFWSSMMTVVGKPSSYRPCIRCSRRPASLPQWQSGSRLSPSLFADGTMARPCSQHGPQ